MFIIRILILTSPNFSLSNSCTVPSYFGEIDCGLTEIASSGIFLSCSSGCCFPASKVTKVLFPVPFSPNRTIISDELKVPGSTVS